MLIRAGDTTKKMRMAVILYVVYRGILDLVYVKWVFPIFGYSGFPLDVDVWKLMFSYVLTLFFVGIIPKNEKRVSYMILQLHLIVMIIPLFTIYGFGNLSTSFMLMVCCGFLIQVCLIRWLPLIKIAKIKNAKVIVSGIIVLFTLATYFYLLRTQSLNLFVWDFSTIYDVRSEQTISGIMGYIITWQYRIINPFLLVVAIMKKNMKLATLALVMQVMLYMMLPHKEVVLAIGLIILVLLIARFKRKFDTMLLAFLSFASFITALIYDYVNYLMPFAIIPVRLLFVSALIKFQHYDYFSVNEKLYYSEGKIGQLLGLEYPYEVPSGFLIGGGSNNANTGYLAYAYDNAGFIGIIMMSLVFVALLILIDSLVRKENKQTIFAILVYPMIILNDGDLLTLLLTGGLALLLVILFVYSNIEGTKGILDEKKADGRFRT